MLVVICCVSIWFPLFGFSGTTVITATPIWLTIQWVLFFFPLLFTVYSAAFLVWFDKKNPSFFFFVIVIFCFNVATRINLFVSLSATLWDLFTSTLWVVQFLAQILFMISVFCWCYFWDVFNICWLEWINELDLNWMCSLFLVYSFKFTIVCVACKIYMLCFCSNTAFFVCVLWNWAV